MRRPFSLGPEVARWAAGLLLVAAALACLVSPFLALSQARQPFPGFLVEPTLVVSALARPSWSGQALAQSYPLRIVQADDVPVCRPADLNAYLRQVGPGTAVRYTVEDPAGRRQVWPETISTGHLSTVDTVILLWIPYLVALAYLACAVWIYRGCWHQAGGRASTVFCATMALTLALFFDAGTGHHLSFLWVAALPLCAAGALHLGLVFPEALPVPKRSSWLTLLPYLPAIGLIVWSLLAQTSSGDPWAYIQAWRGTFFYVSLGAVVLLARLLYAWRFARRPYVRQQARSIFFGGLLGFLPLAVAFAMAAFRLDPTPVVPLIPLSTAAFPFSLAYAIAREYLLDIDRVFSRSLTYSLLTLLLVGVYFGLVALFDWLAPGILRADDPFALALFVILAALLVSPVQRQLRTLGDRLLFSERLHFRRIVQSFSSSLTQVIELPELSHMILQRIAETLHLDAASLYLFDPHTGTYSLYEDLQHTPPERAPVFAETDAFIQSLRNNPAVVYRHRWRGGWLRKLPAEETDRVNLLHAIVFLPLQTRNELVGWLNLGARLSGEAYGTEDLELLRALADRAAVAIENARLFAERERRLNELEVLNEIGQAIHSAHSLQQVLETIWQETSRLMDTTNFYIALYNPEKDEVSFPLDIRGGQRLRPAPRHRGNGLTEYLLKMRQPLLIAEQVEETVRSLGLDVIGPPATSWLGVPIVHEGQSIGAIVVQSTAPDSCYDVQDLTVLSSIADQAATAIGKARLLETADQALSRRMEEITALADFARTLAGVPLDPTQVAELTLRRAADTLRSTTGVLARYEEASDSFTPLAQLCWPAALDWQKAWRGLMPELLATDRDVLVLRSDEAEQLPGPIDGLSTQVICPLLREGSLLAILHLALPASEEPDEHARRFLRQLADHATIALESSLLYEAQVRQGRGLNLRARHLAEILSLSIAVRANMEPDQMPQLLVDAIRDALGFQSVLLDLVDEEHPHRLRRAAAAGLDADTFRRLSAERPLLSTYEALMRPQFRIGHSYMLRLGERAEVSQPDGTRQAAAPDELPYPFGGLNRSDVILSPLWGTGDRLLGILSAQTSADRVAPDQTVIETLEILASQAAVAIENARLYQALRKACERKEEFLSWVAHELHVPMGTLWEYAELLEEGGGEDVDALRGFARVLRANMARLDALVRDLLEVSRIEAGSLQLKRVLLDVSEVVLDSALTFRPLIQRKGLELVLDVPTGLPPVLADRDRLAEILENLVSNAYKYTPPPGTITISTRVYRGLSELLGGGPDYPVVKCPCVVISVQDTGIGLSRQEQKLLFNRFFRGEDPLVRQEEGTGSGLYLVHLLVEALGGQIWMCSETGQGSTFFVALPLASVER